MIWLQYGFRYRLAMLALLWIMLPARRHGVTSIYEILELRIGGGTTAAGCFLLFRRRRHCSHHIRQRTGCVVAAEFTLCRCSLADHGRHFVVRLFRRAVLAVVISDAIQLACWVPCVLLIYIGDLINGNILSSKSANKPSSTTGVLAGRTTVLPMLIGGIFLYAAFTR